MYVDLSGRRQTDFGYRRDGSYARPRPASFWQARAGKPQPRRGGVCPACGCERSVAGRCECNS